MPIKVRNVAEIEINGVCLTLSVKWGSRAQLKPDGTR